MISQALKQTNNRQGIFFQVFPLVGFLLLVNFFATSTVLAQSEVNNPLDLMETSSGAADNAAGSSWPEISVPGELGLDPGLVSSHYYRARVLEDLGSDKNTDPNDPAYNQYRQDLLVLFLDGPEEGATRSVTYDIKSSDPQERLAIGEKVYVVKVQDAYHTSYYIPDRYRLDKLWWVALGFLLLVFATARFKGLAALLGLAFSFLVILKFILPRIMAGQDPLLVCLSGAVIIALVSIYIAHGFKTRTTLAVISTIAVLIITAVLDYIIIHWTQLFGIGTEEAVYAQFGASGIINLRGLLLGGIIIGVLGVLDDITTAQAAVVDELSQANPSLNFQELYRRGLSVGREHITSLINTLVLAYVGASFPLILLFWHYEQPLAFIINGQLVAEEIARSLIGSTALIIAVPLTTALSAYFFARTRLNRGDSGLRSASSESPHHH